MSSVFNCAYSRYLHTLRTLVSATAICILLLLISNRAFAAQATLAWNASTNSQLAGYMLHYGQSSGSYSTKVDVGKATNYTVTGLLEGKTYYFAATAYDAGRIESGYSNEVSKAIAVSAPIANFSASKTSGAAPLTVSFTSTSSGSITGYSWTFGDSSTSTASNPTHEYKTAGAYSVSLTVTGPGGSNTQTKTGLITVSSVTPPSPDPNPTTAPVANFTASATSGSAPLTVNFTNTTTGTVSAYAWTFGDGGTSSAQNPSHTYSAAGTYTVTLKASNTAGSNTQTKSGFITVSATPPTTRAGLVAAYSFDEGAGSTVSDRSGKNNTGTISGASWANGRFGKALYFNGSSSRVNVKDSPSLDLSTGMTVEAWVLSTSFMSGWRTIVLKEQLGGVAYYLYANSDRNEPANGVFAGAERILYGNTQLPAYAWTHLAATYDGSTQRVYVNGAQVSTRAQTGPIRSSDSPLRIGGNAIWGEYFRGLIDEVRIYNRALSTSEIQADMRTPISTAQ